MYRNLHESQCPACQAAWRQNRLPHIDIKGGVANQTPPHPSFAEMLAAPLPDKTALVRQIVIIGDWQHQKLDFRTQLCYNICVGLTTTSQA
jgi:hypothetical protein